MWNEGVAYTYMYVYIYYLPVIVAFQLQFRDMRNTFYPINHQVIILPVKLNAEESRRPTYARLQFCQNN
jgi:hypothetical protein